MITSKIFTIFILYAFINPSFARLGFGPGEQEWGYVTVRPKAHMFWWLYYTTADVNTKYEEKPLIVWLQGGPGVSGTAYGNFEELGPLDTNLKPRNHTWVKDYNVVFIDNPVGTGFSYVESNDQLTKTNEQIAKDLMVCIQEFYKKFPRFGKTPTYILAESYGGKMTVEFANIWYQEQRKENIKSNFKGIGLIDSLIDSDAMFSSRPQYLFNFGMIDSAGYKLMDSTANEYVKATKAGDWMKAVALGSQIEFLSQNLTYHVDRYNIIKRVEPHYYVRRLALTETDSSIYSDALQKIMRKVKSALKLKSVWGAQESAVSRALEEDSMKHVVHHVERLLNETDIKVFVINGQLDLIINTPGTLRWVENMNWKYSRDWLGAPRLPLVVDGIIEGYSRGYANLKFYWINRSGHMVPADNPVAMKPLLEDLTYN